MLTGKQFAFTLALILPNAAPILLKMSISLKNLAISSSALISREFSTVLQSKFRN